MFFEKWKQKFNGIGEPPWEYDFLYNLPESEYPKYLAKVFKYRTGEDLHLKYDFKNHLWIIDKNKCKTFNQKIQYLKLYDATQLKCNCSDKIKVRDYVKEKIGEQYLKPVFQIIPDDIKNNVLTKGEVSVEAVSCAKIDYAQDTQLPPSGEKYSASVIDGFEKRPISVENYFELIDFEKLPNSFVMKANHGSKWQYIIRDKKDYLENKRLFEMTKRNMTGWLEQEFWPWNGFEMQYKGIEPKILVEPLIENEQGQPLEEIEVFCFNGKPKIHLKAKYLKQAREVSYWDENFEQIDLILHPDGRNIIKRENADKIVEQTKELSRKLGEEFKFVRVDWIISGNGLYFNELTFSPYSGFIAFDKKWERTLGEWIEL